MAQSILYQKQKICKKVLTGIGLSDIMITVPRGNKKGRKKMANISMQELSELSSDELLDIKRFIEAEMKVRFDLEITEKAHKLADIIQQIVNLGYTVQESIIHGDLTCEEHSRYVLRDDEKTHRYRITPDYYVHCDDDNMTNHYGYLLEKWNGKEKVWEDITNV